MGTIANSWRPMPAKPDIDAVARALRDETMKLAAPACDYIEIGAVAAFRGDNPGVDPYSHMPMEEWPLEGWRMLARRAVSALG